MIPSHSDTSWLSRRNRGLHMTIRDVDCAGFDVPRFIRDLQDLHVTFFSFFVGGYVTTYPTALEFQRVSPFLNGRDLAGEIFDAARAAGIKTLAMIDTGQLPAHAAQAHPDWAVQDAAGNAAVSADGIFLACPLGGYQREYLSKMVTEILSRYRPDCMKFGGSSFGFPRRICYCPNCRAYFLAATGLALPPEEDSAHPTWAPYNAWRLAHTRRRAVELKEIVRAVDPAMPVMGNGVCFGDPSWTLGAGLDIEHIAGQHDAVQVEIQTRARYNPHTAQADWQWLAWPAETAKFMTTVSDKPIWVVASYFLAWPWRRSAMPAAEQKVYLAQVAANGADPMVNLSGGPPAVHEDPRGFQAIRELYGFLDQHLEYYQGDHSAANVAILYSLDTLRHAADPQQAEAYVDELRGWQQALHAAHIPFDILSTASLSADSLAPYRVIVLPAAACLSAHHARLISDFSAAGGGLAGSYQIGVFGADGRPLADSLLSVPLGAHFNADTRAAVDCPDPGYAQAYFERAAPHPVLAGLEGAGLFPAAGRYCPAQPVPEAVVPLTLSAAFIVFPEGLSYPKVSASADPQLICMQHGSGHNGAGRSVYFPAQIGQLAYNLRCPDHAALLANAVRWAAHEVLPVRVQAPPGLQISIRRQASRRLVHLINLAGTRLFAEPIPLHEIRVTLPIEPGRGLRRAFLLSNREELPVQSDDSGLHILVPKIVDYDVLVVE